MCLTRKQRWALSHAAARRAKDGNRKTLHQALVLARAALGDAVPVRELCRAAASEVDALMDADLRGDVRAGHAAAAPTTGLPQAPRGDAR